MSANELHEHPIERVGNVHDQAILVAADVKDDTIAGHKIDCGAKLTFHVVRTLPASFRRRREPRTQRTLCLRVPLPEFLERPARDNLH
jgi:hypothetical protein